MVEIRFTPVLLLMILTVRMFPRLSKTCNLRSCAGEKARLMTLAPANKSEISTVQDDAAMSGASRSKARSDHCG